MKVLFLTKYDSLGASSRYRFYQFFEFYEQHDIQCVKKPFFSNAYLTSKYKNKKTPFFSVGLAFIKRFYILFTAFRYDKVVIEKELFPYFPAWPEKVLSLLGVEYIVDYDDALFHQYDNHRSKWIRKFLGSKISKVMRYSEMVVAGNDYLADYATHAGAKKVVRVPTVIDLRRYPKEFVIPENPKPVIGWIGTPNTVKYVYDLIPVFEKLYQKIPFVLHIVGADLDDDVGFESKSVKWSEATEVTEMQKFDIGIMPLPDSPWEKGKCGFKLIQYMGCSKPVVASPVGVNSQIVQNGANGYLASSHEAWEKYLLMLLEISKDNQMGLNSRQFVEEKYCIDSVVAKQLSILSGVEP